MTRTWGDVAKDLSTLSRSKEESSDKGGTTEQTSKALNNAASVHSSFWSHCVLHLLCSGHTDLFSPSQCTLTFLAQKTLHLPFPLPGMLLPFLSPRLSTSHPEDSAYLVSARKVFSAHPTYHAAPPNCSLSSCPRPCAFPPQPLPQSAYIFSKINLTEL